MKLAIIGSRGVIAKNMEQYIPKNVTEIVSGGAKGVDTCAREYALEQGIRLTVFLPEYEKYKKGALLKRNLQIIDYADEVLAFWDGKSRGTKFVIDQCQKRNKKVTVIEIVTEREMEWKNI